MPFVVLLGPQRFDPTVAAVLDSLRVEGTVAAITAGWQEREQEVDELRDHVRRELVNLRLYERAEDVLASDASLAAALREGQENVRELQALYRARLAHALDAARELLAREGASALLRDAQRAAIRALRSLDRQHLVRLRRLRTEFDRRVRPGQRPAVARHRRELAELLSRAAVVTIAGGHVAVLLNRLRLFDLPGLIGKTPVVAWSAGAMAVVDRVVLFHDSPPQGPGNAEVFEAGLDLCRGVIPLPHARRRLRLDDPVRVALFARRFAPCSCAVLEGPARLLWNGAGWRAEEGARSLTRLGGLAPLGRRTAR